MVVISSQFSGLTKIAFGPPISGIDDVLLVMTGVPHAIASNKGMPKLSRSDVYKNAKALLKISDRDRVVIMKRYVDGLSQSEIAAFLNISQAQVSRIESNAINVIKKLIL